MFTIHILVCVCVGSSCWNWFCCLILPKPQKKWRLITAHSLYAMTCPLLTDFMSYSSAVSSHSKCCSSLNRPLPGLLAQPLLSHPFSPQPQSQVKNPHRRPSILTPPLRTPVRKGRCLMRWDEVKLYRSLWWSSPSLVAGEHLFSFLSVFLFFLSPRFQSHSPDSCSYRSRLAISFHRSILLSVHTSFASLLTGIVFQHSNRVNKPITLHIPSKQEVMSSIRGG